MVDLVEGESVRKGFVDFRERGKTPARGIAGEGGSYDVGG